MNNADDRCAHMLASGPCGVWRDTHPQIPFKPEFMHAFVEPAPQPAPSGDEAKVRETFATWPRPVCHEIRCCAGCFTRGVCDQIMWDSGYAAGKADGAREEREACEGIARKRSVAWSDNLGDEGMQQRSDEARDIADAIARRGSEGK